MNGRYLSPRELKRVMGPEMYRKSAYIRVLFGPFESESTMQQRYLQLHLDAALSRRHDYAQACKELACILRRTYAKAPKPVQLLMYQDVLTAFRSLPGMDTFQQLSAAEVLLQAVEASLPKKRRAAAVSEYRQAAVTQHRRAKHQESEKRGDVDLLPTDVLRHILGCLDPRSLAISSAVCRSWKDISNDDIVWHPHFLFLFRDQNFNRKTIGLNATSGFGRLSSENQTTGSEVVEQGYWRLAVVSKLSRQGHSSRLFVSNRAFCMGCKTLFWHSEPPEIRGNGKNCAHQHYTSRPATVAQVLTFVLREPHSSGSSSSSGSDTDEEFRTEPRNFSRLWAYPRIEQ